MFVPLYMKQHFEAYQSKRVYWQHELSTLCLPMPHAHVTPHGAKA